MFEIASAMNLFFFNIFVLKNEPIQAVVLVSALGISLPLTAEWFSVIILSLLPSLSGNSLRHTAHTHCASVHQAVKLVPALLKVAGVTAGLAKSNGSLPPGL